MKYNRLIAFGCSWTYGDFLPDCYDPVTKYCTSTASKMAWPNILADKLNINSLNKGIPGGSNKQIWKSIVETELSCDDLVIIFWTFHSRSAIFAEDGETIRLIPNRNSKHRDFKLTENYYKNFYNDVESIFDTNLRVSHANLYLKEKQVDVLNASIHNSYYRLVWNTVNMLDLDIHSIANNHPKAIDNHHPGIEAHKEFAEELYKEIKIKSRHEL